MRNIEGSRWNAIARVLCFDLTVKHRRIVGLTHVDLRIGAALTQALGNTLQRAASAVSTDKVVEADVLGLECIDNLWARGYRVYPGVRFVFELVRPVPAMLVGEFLGLDDHASPLMSCLYVRKWVRK